MRDKNFSEILTGSALTFSVKVLTVVFGLISNLIIAKYYGAEILGTISVLFSVMGIAAIFSLLGMDVSILRFIPPLIKQKNYSDLYETVKKTFLLVSFFGLLNALFVYMFSDFIAAEIFKKDYLSTLLSFISFFIFIQAITKISSSTVRALKSIKLFLTLQFLPSFLNLFILLIVTFFFYTEYNPLYSQLGSQFLVLIASLFVLNKLLFVYKNKNNKNSTISYKKIISVSFPMFLTTAMQAIVLQTDVLMLGSMSTLENVGIYSIVMKLALLSSFIISSINTIIAPKFSELYYNDEMDELKITAKKSSKLIFFASLPISIILIIFGQQLLSIFGNKFEIGYYSLLLLTLGQLVNAMAGSVGYMLNMTGHQKEFNKIVLLGALSNVALNVLFIPKYGINGAAFASMVSAILWNVLASIYIKKYFGFYIGYIPLIKRRKQCKI